MTGGTLPQDKPASWLMDRSGGSHRDRGARELRDKGDRRGFNLTGIGPEKGGGVTPLGPAPGLHSANPPEVGLRIKGKPGVAGIPKSVS